MKRGVAADIPPDVYVAIARDPKQFERMLGEWEKRRAAAVEAVAIAAQRKEEAERAESKSKAALEQLAEDSAALAAERAAFDARDGVCLERESDAATAWDNISAARAALDELEAAVAAMREQALAGVKRMSAEPALRLVDDDVLDEGE